MENLHTMLKTQTADLHAAIEKNSLMHRVMDEDLRPEEYSLLLQKMFDFYVTVEKKLAAIPDLANKIPDYSRRLKSTSLIQDLKNLNLSPEGRTPWIGDLAIEDLSQAMGVLYVIEGSSLGGQVMAKKLRGHDFIAENNLHFFNHYGADTGLYWRRFLSFMDEEWQAGHINAARAVASARQTFSAMMSHLRA